MVFSTALYLNTWEISVYPRIRIRDFTSLFEMVSFDFLESQAFFYFYKLYLKQCADKALFGMERSRRRGRRLASLHLSYELFLWTNGSKWRLKHFLIYFNSIGIFYLKRYRYNKDMKYKVIMRVSLFPVPVLFPEVANISNHVFNLIAPGWKIRKKQPLILNSPYKTHVIP